MPTIPKTRKVSKKSFKAFISEFKSFYIKSANSDYYMTLDTREHSYFLCHQLTNFITLLESCNKKYVYLERIEILKKYISANLHRTTMTGYLLEKYTKNTESHLYGNYDSKILRIQFLRDCPDLIFPPKVRNPKFPKKI